MSNSKRTGGARPKSIFQTLQATEMINSKAALPAEILVAILDYLPVPDQLRFARASRRMREMVYDDTRWIARLKCMGCWDEAEARRRFEDAMRRRAETARAAAPKQQADAAASAAVASTTLFDASLEQERLQRQVVDGFEVLHLGPGPGPGPPQRDVPRDPDALLRVLDGVRSVRGHAREEYGRVYGALAPFYFDLARSASHAEPAVFSVFRDPEQQARMLANLRAFARSDWADGCAAREDRLRAMEALFEGAALREFEQGYESRDVEGRMRRYARVLDALNGGAAAVDLFVQKHPIFSEREAAANSMDCITQAAAGDVEGVTLEPSRLFLEVLVTKVNEQAEVMQRIFPRPAEVFWTLVDKVREDVVTEYTTLLFDETHERHLPSYLKAVSGVFEQVLQFFRALTPPGGGGEGRPAADSDDRTRDMALQIFEPHLDLYLQEELDCFVRHAESQVASWEKQLSEQDASAESFYMAGFNRQADKKDFLSTFKKVVMMPVTALPTSLGLPLSSPFGGAKPSAATLAAQGPAGQAAAPARPSTPQTPLAPGGPVGGALERKSSPLPEKAPTDELAAKAALMTSRLEGIKSLFSIEVALNLVHAAKSSLDRAAVFLWLGGQAGGEAREQCESIFVSLLRILGNRHVKAGFDKAVDHLSHYNPREVGKHDDKSGVAPLVTFIELVNVGDLISQMIDVFYEQQMAGPKIADRNDFLDPAGLAKKKFEQMLDESVAAGLNKGIDVLMDEVEYICATTQQPTDYNPPPAADNPARGAGAGADIGPSPTARRVVELVSSHTRMLVGSTEKAMLDVFNGEVGLRLFTSLCKHLKRQRVSTDGAVTLIADMNLYSDFARGLRNADLLAYFGALRELSQIYLIDPGHAREMATIIADGDRFGGVFRAEEVYEYAERRADWYQVKRDVERAMYGLECALM